MNVKTSFSFNYGQVMDFIMTDSDVVIFIKGESIIISIDEFSRLIKFMNLIKPIEK